MRDRKSSRITLRDTKKYYFVWYWYVNGFTEEGICLELCNLHEIVAALWKTADALRVLNGGVDQFVSLFATAEIASKMKFVILRFAS